MTRKITRGLARIAVGLQDHLYLGNLNCWRDWGHGADYVKMQWLMLQQDEPDDYVIATGKQYSVRQFVTMAAAELGLRLIWEGTGRSQSMKKDSRIYVAGHRGLMEPGRSSFRAVHASTPQVA